VPIIPNYYLLKTGISPESVTDIFPVQQGQDTLPLPLVRVRCREGVFFYPLIPGKMSILGQTVTVKRWQGELT